MKYLRRFVWFIASRLLLIAVILGLMVTVFYYAMNLMNIRVVLKDGMARRAQTVMMMDDGSELNKYFSAAFIDKDGALQAARQGTSPYTYYNVRGIDHRLSMDFFWVWPWDEKARVDIEERIPRIDGRAKGTYAEKLVTQNGSAALYPPPWQGARYRAVLTRENDSWHIQSLTYLQSAGE